MILCKKELAYKLWIENTVGQGVRDRPSFIAQLEVQLSDEAPKSTLYIASVHLTAYEQYPKVRKAELERLIVALNAICDPEAAVMILGDFNFHAEEETASIPAEFYDVWLQLKGLKTDAVQGSDSAADLSDLAYTYDPNHNTMISRVYPPERRRMRLDRVIMNVTSKKHVKPIQISKFADQPIPTSAGVREGTFASDHYGLRVVLGNP
jgi:endonuclease/exonuclease/phosphatase family metal-dependent hydrolase